MKKTQQNIKKDQDNKKGFWFKFSIREMVICALILSMFIAAKSINSLIPELMPGIKFQLIYILLPIISLVFGWKISGITMSIYIFIIAWLAPTFFIHGITYVKGVKYVFLEYLLDYVIPVLSLAIIPGLVLRFENKLWVFLFITIAFVLTFLSHFTAGIVMWGSYAQWGYGPVAYSAAANSIVVWSAFGFSAIFAYPCVTRIRIAINGIFVQKGYEIER
ncbi:energy-coupled thiamine transporter ThiT [Mycoplasma todarodis]|uniref:energy-coupled thiamine transporter ThiT n=1 Tax=Mycoplasma todarodis TaxID=1937191 RepID=UPI003B2DC74D